MGRNGTDPSSCRKDLLPERVLQLEGSEIARAAELADGTIYLYFRSKDDLLISLFEEKMGEVVADVLRGSPSAGTPWKS